MDKETREKFAYAVLSTNEGFLWKIQSTSREFTILFSFFQFYFQNSFFLLDSVFLKNPSHYIICISMFGITIGITILWIRDRNELLYA